MINEGITRENLLLVVPHALTHDPSIMALAKVNAEALAARLAEIDRVRVISNIDGLDEAVLDILARDFKVDWWDPNFNLTEKRRTLKSSWRVHKTLGTKAAVDEAISAIYPNSCAKPWFEYGGEPYHFRFEINTSETIAGLEKQSRVLGLARYYKSLRDHLDEIHYTLEAKAPAVFHMGGTLAAVVCLPVPEDKDSFDFRGAVMLGGGMCVAASIPVLEQPDAPTFAGEIRTGGSSTVAATVPVPEQPDEPTFAGTIRTGGNSAIAATMPVPEQPDEPTFAGTIRTGGNSAIAASVPVPEQPDSPDYQFDMRTGGKCSVISTIPVAESKEE